MVLLGAPPPAYPSPGWRPNPKCRLNLTRSFYPHLSAEAPPSQDGDPCCPPHHLPHDSQKEHFKTVYTTVCTVCAKSLQSCLTLYDPMGCSPPGCSVHGILQEYCHRLPSIPFSRHLPDPRIKPRSPALQTDSLPSEPPGKPGSVKPESFGLALAGGFFTTSTTWEWVSDLSVGQSLNGGSGPGPHR